MFFLLVGVGIFAGCLVLAHFAPDFLPDDYELDPEEERRHDEEMKELYRQQEKRRQDARDAANMYWLNHH